MTCFRSILWIALLISGLVRVGDAAAARISVVQMERFDSQNNGSIDLDLVLGHNLRQDAPVECNLALDGPIEQGDFEALKNLTNRFGGAASSKVARLCLNSPGGDYREGLRISEHLMSQHIGTAVGAGAECYSACAIIFMGGSYPWKGELNRYLHVRGTLGFHAPYIPDSKGAGNLLVDAEQVRLAFSEGIRAMSDFMRLGVGNHVKRITPELMAEMMAQGPDQFFLIDTVGKAIRSRIHLYGIEPIPALDPQGMCNACVNMNYGAMDEYGIGGQVDLCRNLPPFRRETHQTGIRYINDIAPRGGECEIDVQMKNGRVSSWVFQTAYQSGFATGVELAHWYLASPSTRLTDLSASKAAPSRDGGTRTATDAPLRDRLLRFAVVEYLGHGRTNHQGRHDLFAPHVSYYKKGIISRDALLADKAAYYKRWPNRRYELINDSLSAGHAPNGSVNVTFRYIFEVSNGKETRRGIGTATLGVAFMDGRFQIISEDGRVIQKF